MKILTLLIFLASTQVFAQKILEIEPKKGWTEHDCTGEREPTEPPAYLINTIKVVYETLDHQKKPIRAAGLIAYRNNMTKVPYITSYQHGTQISRNGVPSLANYKMQQIICSYLELDTIMLLPDYVGMSESKIYHPFLDSFSEAAASYHLILAALKHLDQSNIKYRKELAISGYSQGGHATVALQSVIERANNFPLALKVSVPMASPVSISVVGVNSILGSTYSKSTSMYALYLMTALDKNFDLYKKIGFPFRDEFKDAVSSIESRQTVFALWYAPWRPSMLFKDQILEDLKQRTNTELLAQLRKLDLDHIKFKSRTHIIASKGDEVVDVEHSLRLYKNQAGARHVTLHLLGDEFTHSRGKMPSIEMSKKFIKAAM